jgi:hypothetical protein
VKTSSGDASADALRCYEDLRTQVLDRERGPGLAIFLRHGMREWIEVCCSCTPGMAAVKQVHVSTNPEYLLPEMRSEIVSILAGLFLNQRGEATQ